MSVLYEPLISDDNPIPLLPPPPPLPQEMKEDSMCSMCTVCCRTCFCKCDDLCCMAICQTLFIFH